MGISNIDDVDILELIQLLLSPEGQESVQEYLAIRDKKAALDIVWGGATSCFLPDTTLHRAAYDRLEKSRPW